MQDFSAQSSTQTYDPYANQQAPAQEPVVQPVQETTTPVENNIQAPEPVAQTENSAQIQEPSTSTENNATVNNNANTNVKLCMRCGNINTADSLFCNKCGNQLQ